ncbi:hypothetical protein [Modestobacter marinus]|uniref:hypothetical protein n=1 Tax=Modestobacter marinus TaxID=477641 RepID=UPI001C98BB41|nr:hypothetical protein [Modestobacter marinus]
MADDRRGTAARTGATARTTTRTPVRGTRPARLRRPARTRWRLARWLTPVVGVAAGGLVAASQLAPAVLDVAAAATSRAIPNGGVTVSSGVGSTALSGGLSFEHGTIAGDSGGETVGDSSTSSGGLVVPQPPRPAGVSIRPWAAHGVAPVLTPREPACGGTGSPRRVSPGVTAGVGSATVTFPSDNRGEVQGYRVAAVSQDAVAGRQPAPVAVTVAQPEGCQQVTASLPGLTRGTYYVFWLEESITSPATGVTRLEQVGTSAPVLIR